MAHQAADEYSEAMQQLLERVSDSNSSQTPGSSGQNTVNNVLGHVGKVPNTVPSVNKLNPNISQPIPIPTQTPDLKFAVLNVCGLKIRSLYPEFQELVSNYSMFFACETKLDTNDLISMNGYTFINQPRRQNYKRKSGGIEAFVKNTRNKYVDVIKTDSDFILWLKLNKNCLKCTQDIILALCMSPLINRNISLKISPIRNNANV